MKMTHAYVWEFLVAPGRVRHFEKAYGPSGKWVALFRRAPGYLRTELHRDCSNPLRFLTIDYWESRADWEAFRSRFAAEFETLDARCERMTEWETEIGRFDLVS